MAEHPNIQGTLDVHAWPIRYPNTVHTGRRSGVLIVHMESGLAVVESGYRSRYQNEQEALAKLAALLETFAKEWIV